MKSISGLEDVKKKFDVSRETGERLTIFHDLLVRWQASINLIAPSTVSEIWQRHISDSLVCCQIIGDAETVIDIGSGAGFPGLVQAIVKAQGGSGSIHLVESVGKKCTFLNTVIRETGLRDAGITINVHNGRIEQVLPKLDMPDVVSARALASLDKLLTMSAMFLTRGATGVFPKGRDHQIELELAERYWQFECETTISPFEADSVILKITGLKRR